MRLQRGNVINCPEYRRHHIRFIEGIFNHFEILRHLHQVTSQNLLHIISSWPKQQDYWEYVFAPQTTKWIIFQKREEKVMIRLKSNHSGVDRQMFELLSTNKRENNSPQLQFIAEGKWSKTHKSIIRPKNEQKSMALHYVGYTEKQIREQTYLVHAKIFWYPQCQKVLMCINQTRNQNWWCK